MLYCQLDGNLYIILSGWRESSCYIVRLTCRRAGLTTTAAITVWTRCWWAGRRRGRGRGRGPGGGRSPAPSGRAWPRATTVIHTSLETSSSESSLLQLTHNYRSNKKTFQWIVYGCTVSNVRMSAKSVPVYQEGRARPEPRPRHQPGGRLVPPHLGPRRPRHPQPGQHGPAHTTGTVQCSTVINYVSYWSYVQPLSNTDFYNSFIINS